jgi:predicted MFS family arabinose efflux permease
MIKEEAMNKRAIIFVMVAIMVFTFCTAPPAHAIVPVVAWVVWGIATAATGVAVTADKTRGDHRQAQASDQRQEEPKGVENTASALQQSPG